MLVNGKPRFINPISKRTVMVTCILFETVHNFYHMKSAIKYTSFFFKECKLEFLQNIILFLHKLLSRDLISFWTTSFASFTLRFSLYYKAATPRARQRAGFSGPVSGLRIWKSGFRAGFRVALRVPGPGENPDINYVFLHLKILWYPAVYLETHS